MTKWILFKGYNKQTPFSMSDAFNLKGWKTDHSINIDGFVSHIYYKWNDKTRCFNYLFEVPKKWLSITRVIKVNTYTGAIYFDPEIKDFPNNIQSFIKDAFVKNTEDKKSCFTQTKYSYFQKFTKAVGVSGQIEKYHEFSHYIKVCVLILKLGE